MHDFYNDNKFNVRKKCVVCHRSTYFVDQVCGLCRVQVPEHLPQEQVKRYVLRIKKGITKYA